MDRYAVIGFPIKHSFSPEIHNFAFKRLALDAMYEKIEIHPDTFQQKIMELKNSGIKGINITVPFKKQIIQYLDEINPIAKTVNAVNTVKSVNGKWFGFNTDIDGFLDPIKKERDKISKIFIAGAGGAAYAVTYACLDFFNLAQITIANRNPENGQKLVSQIQSLSLTTSQYIPLQKVPEINEKFDLIINTTSAGMGNQKNINPVDITNLHHSQSIVYDLIYNPHETLFLKQAKFLGLKYLNGLEMLIGQAKKSFEIWTGHAYPDETEIYNILKEKNIK